MNHTQEFKDLLAAERAFDDLGPLTDAQFRELNRICLKIETLRASGEHVMQPGDPAEETLRRAEAFDYHVRRALDSLQNAMYNTDSAMTIERITRLRLEVNDLRESV